jgi:hypothetical protein
MSKVKDEKPTLDSVLIEVPLAEVSPQTWGLHINTRLTPEQSHVLRRLTAALGERLVKLANDQRVVNASGALKYLLEQIGSGDVRPIVGKMALAPSAVPECR